MLANNNRVICTLLTSTNAPQIGQVFHSDWRKVQPTAFGSRPRQNQSPLYIACGISGVLPLEGESSIVFNRTATDHLISKMSNSKETCVAAAMKDFKPSYRDTKIDEVRVQKGEMLIWLDRVVHAGAAGTNPKNLRLAFSIPFGKSVAMVGEVVPIRNHSGPLELVKTKLKPNKKK
jgi:hypothetical protein